MADPAVLGLIGTLSGTALGFAGGLVTQLLLERRKQVADKKKRKAEKLEELVSVLYAHKDWVNAMIANFDKGVDLMPPPAMPKIRAICSVYFPEFQSHIHEIAAFSAFRIFAADGQFAPPEGVTNEEGRKQLFEKEQQLTFFLENEIGNYAKREFQ